MRFIDSVRVALLLAPLLVVATTSGATPPPNLHFRLVNTQLCVAKKFNHVKDGNPVHLWSCKTSANEDWVYNPSNGTIVLAGDNSKCLSTKYTHTKDGNPVHLWTCKGEANQRWKVVETSEGALRIHPLSNTLSCLSYPKGNAKEGAALQLWSCNDPPSIRWTHALIAGIKQVRGDSCFRDNECRTGACSCGQSVCTQGHVGRCHAKGGHQGVIGDYCLYNSECASNNCHSSECISRGADLRVGSPELSSSDKTHSSPKLNVTSYTLVTVNSDMTVSNATLTCTLRKDKWNGKKLQVKAKTITVKKNTPLQQYAFNLGVLPEGTYYMGCSLQAPAGSVPDPVSSNNTAGNTRKYPPTTPTLW